MGSQHPSPNVKTFGKFEPQIWLEIITSRDAKSACFKGSRTSCREISFGIFLQIHPPPVFFFGIFFVIFTGIRCGADFFCNSHALFGESRGYCTKTKQEWPGSGSMLENIFCNFYEINSSQNVFFVLQKRRCSW